VTPRESEGRRQRGFGRWWAAVNPAEKDEACAESVCSREWDDKQERGVIGKTKDICCGVAGKRRSRRSRSRSRSWREQGVANSDDEQQRRQH
jgi:hypothetical protein